MSKGDVLALLREDEYISGEEISRKLGVSRAAVWKAVKALRGEGCHIDSVPNRGYCLRRSGRLNPPLLRERAAPWSVIVPEQVDSTNNVAKQLGAQGAPHGTVVVTERQTGGRGRLGRRFASPPGGVYLSVLLRPGAEVRSLLHLTAMAAVAVRRAIADCCDLKPDIKWMNDLLWQKKKLCGILTELSCEADTGRLEYAVVGIGVNCNTRLSDLPEEVRPMATSLALATEREIDPNAMALALIRRLQEMSAALLGDRAAWMQEYRRACITVGKQVLLVRGTERRSALALDVDGEGGLVVRYEDGSTGTVNSGEVSVRGIYGYQ